MLTKACACLYLSSGCWQEKTLKFKESGSEEEEGGGKYDRNTSYEILEELVGLFLKRKRG